MMNTYKYLAAEGYNCDAYGQHAFGECPTDTGGLSPTGDMVILPLALGASILIASAIYLGKQLRRRKLATSKTPQ